MTPPPVLIVFVREPIPGRTKTRLQPHLTARQAADLSRAFFLDTVAKVRSLRPAKLVIAARIESRAGSSYFRAIARRFRAELVDQGPGTLGARMARSLSPFTEKGGALLIGTDIPSLPKSALSELLELLERRRLVIGPSLDGGYYAVGVRGSLPPIFDRVSWGSRKVFSQTALHAKKAGVAVASGPVWHDVDRWGELLLLGSYLARIEPDDLPAREHPCPATAAVLRRLGLLRPRK